MIRGIAWLGSVIAYAAVGYWGIDYLQSDSQGWDAAGVKVLLGFIALVAAVIMLTAEEKERPSEKPS